MPIWIARAGGVEVFFHRARVLYHSVDRITRLTEIRDQIKRALSRQRSIQRADRSLDAVGSLQHRKAVSCGFHADGTSHGVTRARAALSTSLHAPALTRCRG